MNRLKNLTGVIGNPISHSLSPDIHNYWLKKYQVNSQYFAFKVTNEEELEKTIIDLPIKHFIGVNITIPYKEFMYNLIKKYGRLEENAKIIGAVNTVYYHNNELLGFNTDYYGFTQTLLQHYKLDPNDQSFFQNKNILVIGAGGAAKSICYAFIKKQVSQLFIANRSIEKAENLAENFIKHSKSTKIIPMQLHDISSKLSDIDIMVNTTPLGMKGYDDLDIDLSKVNPNCLVYDIIYSPSQTKLLIEAKKYGCPTINGLKMLLYQAVPAFKLWHDKLPAIDEFIIEKLNNKLSES